MTTILKIFGLLLSAVVLSLLLNHDRGLAQSSVNLQADLFSLRSEVRQLRAEVAQLRGQRGFVAPPPSRSRSPQLNDGQIIDRLATLAIEAKDRLTALENRMTRLEQSTQRR